MEPNHQTSVSIISAKFRDDPLAAKQDSAWSRNALEDSRRTMRSFRGNVTSQNGLPKPQSTTNIESLIKAIYSGEDEAERVTSCASLSTVITTHSDKLDLGLNNASLDPPRYPEYSQLETPNPDFRNNASQNPTKPPTLPSSCHNQNGTRMSTMARRRHTVSSDSCFGSQADSSSIDLSRGASLRMSEVDGSDGEDVKVDDDDDESSSKRVRINVSGTKFEVSCA